MTNLLATPAAKGLFHKAIVQSGSLLHDMEAKYSRRIGQLTVEELGLKPDEVDKLATVPYEELLAAGERAVTQRSTVRVKKEAEADGMPSMLLFGWAPTVDGNVMPAHPFDPQAPAQSKDIPSDDRHHASRVYRQHVCACLAYHRAGTGGGDGTPEVWRPH